LEEITKDGNNWQSQALKEVAFLLLLCYFVYVLLFTSYEHWSIIFHGAPCSDQVLVMEHSFHESLVV
jgi:hypothetical protein